MVLIVTILSWNNANAQLLGEWQILNNGQVYFKLSNPTYYYVTFNWYAVNEYLNQQRGNTFTLYPNNYTLFGPNVNWRWERGEKFYVYYSNGTSRYWVCPYTDTYNYSISPSFGGSQSDYNGKKCTIIMSNGMYCSCSGCRSGNWDPYTCQNCPHKCEKHTRN